MRFTLSLRALRICSCQWGRIFLTLSLKIFGRREEAKQLMGAAQTKTNATQNEVNIIIIKIDDRVTKVDISPKLTSH